MYSAIGIFSQRSCAVYAAEWSIAFTCVICVASFCAIFVRKYTQSFRNGSRFRDSVPLWKPHVAVTFAVAFQSGIVLLFPFRNGSKTRESVPLWQPCAAVTFAVAFQSGIVLLFPFRNGSKYRESVPLWQPCVVVTFAVAFQSGIVLRFPFRNGSKSRESVPLWKSGRRGIRQKIIGT